MSTHRNRALRATAVGAALVIFAGVLLGGAGAPAAAQAPRGTLTFVQSLLPLTPDPHVEFLNSSFHVQYAMFDPLARVNEDGKLTPYLATSWKWESPTSWVFELRRNVRWHDGAPFTSKDVVWSISRILDPATRSIWGRIYSFVERAEAIDDHTVRIRTKTPSVAVPQDFGRMAMLPKDQFERAGKDAFFQRPIGTGPFKFVRQVRGEQIVMEANLQYWGGPAKVKTLIFKGVTDEATRVAELLAGTADIVDGIPPADAQRVNASGRANVIFAPTVRRVLLDFAVLTTPELKDKKVRLAVAHAINTRAINIAVYGGQAGRQTGWLDRFSWGYNTSLKPYIYDPAKSKRLLAEAGFPNGLPLTFMMGRGRFLLDHEVGLAIADFLGKAGFTIDFKVFEWGTYSAMRTRKEFKGVYMLSSGNSTGEPDQVFRTFDSQREAIYIVDQKLDDLIHEQMGEPNREKRAKIVATVDAYVHENMLSFNLMTIPGVYGLNKRVTGFKPSPFEIFTFANVGVQ
ncbi:MAG: ABC transporter substrate-binding protein [Armatimonadota bacterium]